MSFDVTQTITPQEIDLPSATVEGLWYYKREPAPSAPPAPAVEAWTTDPDVDTVWMAIASGTFRFTSYRTNSLSPGGAQIGPLVQKDVAIGVAPPPADTTPPVVTITRPQNGETLSGFVTFEATITDDSPITTQEVRIDGGSIITHTDPYDTEALSDGVHNMTWRAVDASSNETTASRSFFVSNVSPPSSERQKAIWLGSDRNGRLRVALWAEVPLSVQPAFAEPGLKSVWAAASGQENQDIADGKVAERVILLIQKDKSDNELQVASQEEWVRFNATIQALDTGRDSIAWDGSLWRFVGVG